MLPGPNRSDQGPGKGRLKSGFGGSSEHLMDPAGMELHKVAEGKKLMVQPCLSPAGSAGPGKAAVTPPSPALLTAPTAPAARS